MYNIGKFHLFYNKSGGIDLQALIGRYIQEEQSLRGASSETGHDGRFLRIGSQDLYIVLSIYDFLRYCDHQPVNGYFTQYRVISTKGGVHKRS